MQISKLPSKQNNSIEKYFPLALLALCAGVFFYGLGSLPFIGPDEPRYAQVAREMFISGDWVTTKLSGINWFEKPALTYWLSATGYWLFGENEFGARFFIAVFATVGVLLVYGFGKRIRSARFGFLSAAVLTTCGMWPGFARVATFDMPLSVAMTLALASFFVWEQSVPRPVGSGFAEGDASQQRRSLPVAVLTFFALGLGVLAKGLVGIVLPAAVIGLYLLLTRRLKILFRPKLLLIGAVIFLATAATWYAPVIAKHGREFINEFFIGHHFQRYLSNKYKHPQPFYFFFLVALAGSFPWTFYLLSSAWQSLKNWREILADRLRLFLWLWVAVTIGFFSFSGSKLPGYVLPIFPAIALLVGLELEKWWQQTPGRNRDREKAAGSKILVGLTAAFIAIVGIAAIFVSQRELGVTAGSAWLIGGVTVAVAGVFLILWLWRGGQLALMILPFSLIAVIVTATHLIFPALGNRESLKPLAQAARLAAQPGEKLVFFVNEDHGINFYATELPWRDTKSELVSVTSPDNIELMIQASQTRSILVASRKRWVEGVTKAEKLVTEKVAEQNYNARCSPDCDWVLLRARRRQ
ncbi:MAG: glycosyltransferase family 39 protein [Acidobacteria bacterium]|nr:glycosyltransferase family 39 protein [Acidobacteriota bacterium]